MSPVCAKLPQNLEDVQCGRYKVSIWEDGESVLLKKPGHLGSTVLGILSGEKAQAFIDYARGASTVETEAYIDAHMEEFREGAGQLFEDGPW